MLQPQFFFLSPVSVLKVTKENINEVAEWCGGTVAETDSRRRPGTMDSYILVPTPENSAISWAFPGMYITQRLVITGKGEMKKSWAVFKRDYFEKNYFDNPSDAVEKTWEAEHEKRNAKRVEIDVQVHVGEIFKEAMERTRQAVEKAAKDGGLTSEETAQLVADIPTEPFVPEHNTFAEASS